MRKICIFAADFGFPKRTTFWRRKRKKFPETVNFRVWNERKH